MQFFICAILKTIAIMYSTHQLSSTLAQVDLSLLAADVSIAATATLDGSQGIHHLYHTNDTLGKRNGSWEAHLKHAEEWMRGTGAYM